MNHRFFALAAIVAMAAGLAACGSDEIEGSLPSAKPAGAAQAEDGESMAAEEGEAMAAEDAAAEEDVMMEEEVTTEEMTVEEVSPEGVETDVTVTETEVTEEVMTEEVMTDEEMAAIEETPAPEQTYEERLTEREMLREVRNGSYAIRYCENIDDINLTVFDDCVRTQLATAETDGELTESYKLGADYQAWLFLGEHADAMHQEGYEWTKEYRQVFRSRMRYQKNVQDLIRSTGLDMGEVCSQLRGDCER